MTEYEAHANKMRSRFETEVEDVYSGLSGQVQYDNRKFTPPDDGSLHARFTINWGASAVIAPGPQKRRRTVGVLQVQLFQRIDTGDKALLELADAISLVFTAQTVQGIRYRAASVRKIGRSGNGRLWQVNVNIPFQFDSLST